MMQSKTMRSGTSVWSESLTNLFTVILVFGLAVTAEAQQVSTGGMGSTGGSRTSTGGSGAAAGFVGGNNATEQFVGANRQAATNSQSANRQFRGIQDSGNRGNTTQQQTGTPRSMPVGLRVGFSAPSAASINQLSAANAASFQQFRQIRPEFNGLNVEVSTGGVAIISGFTTSVETRSLAANLIRLQPGIRRVENQIQIAGSQIEPLNAP